MKNNLYFLVLQNVIEHRVSGTEHRESTMPQATSNNDLSNRGAQAILDAFSSYRTQFKDITRRSQTHFIERNWQAMRVDATRRLALYRQAVDRIEIDIRHLLADRSQDKSVWADLKTAYSGLLVSSDDWELAETFFNSITRRIFSTVGVNATIEYVNTDFDIPPGKAKSSCFATLENQPPDSRSHPGAAGRIPLLDPLSKSAA